MQIIAKYLIFAGVLLILIGGCILLGAKLPWFGKLPGDIIVQREGFSFYFPITTCILISVVLSLVMYFFGRK